MKINSISTNYNAQKNQRMNNKNNPNFSGSVSKEVLNVIKEVYKEFYSSPDGIKFAKNVEKFIKKDNNMYLFFEDSKKTIENSKYTYFIRNLTAKPEKNEFFNKRNAIERKIKKLIQKSNDYKMSDEVNKLEEFASATEELNLPLKKYANVYNIDWCGRTRNIKVLDYYNRIDFYTKQAIRKAFSGEKNKFSQILNSNEFEKSNNITPQRMSEIETQFKALEDKVKAVLKHKKKPLTESDNFIESIIPRK